MGICPNKYSHFMCWSSQCCCHTDCSLTEFHLSDLEPYASPGLSECERRNLSRPVALRRESPTLIRQPLSRVARNCTGKVLNAPLANPPSNGASADQHEGSYLPTAMNPKLITWTRTPKPRVLRLQIGLRVRVFLSLFALAELNRSLGFRVRVYGAVDLAFRLGWVLFGVLGFSGCQPWASIEPL